LESRLVEEKRTEEILETAKTFGKKEGGNLQKEKDRNLEPSWLRIVRGVLQHFGVVGERKRDMRKWAATAVGQSFASARQQA